MILHSLRNHYIIIDVHFYIYRSIRPRFSIDGRRFSPYITLPVKQRFLIHVRCSPESVESRFPIHGWRSEIPAPSPTNNLFSTHSELSFTFAESYQCSIVPLIQSPGSNVAQTLVSLGHLLRYQLIRVQRPREQRSEDDIVGYVW